jgi:WD40 repeat protein
VIASVSKDGLQHWRYAKGKWVAGSKTLGTSQFEVDLSLDGRYALTADRDGDNALWDLETGESLLTLEEGELVSLCPDGRHAAFASGKWVTLMDLRNQETRTFQAEQPIKGILLAADRRHLLAFDEVSRLYSWEIKTGDLFSAQEKGLVYDMAITPGAHYAVVSSTEGVALWDMRTWDRMDVLENPRRMIFRTLAVSMNGRYVLAAGEQLSLWELVWEYKFPDPAEWDSKANSYLDNFLALHTPLGGEGEQPQFENAEIDDFLTDLGYRGLGWLDSAAIRSRLEEEVKK